MSARARAKACSLNLWPRSQRSSLPSALKSGRVLSYSPFRNPPRKPGNLAPTFLEDGTVQIYSINIPPTAHYIFIGGTRQARGGKKLCNNVCCSRSYCGHLWPLNSGGDSVWEWK